MYLWGLNRRPQGGSEPLGGVLFSRLAPRCVAHRAPRGHWIRLLFDDEPELARTMAASVTQPIAFWERAGQQVRRFEPGCGYEGERPALHGTRCASVNDFSLHANTQVPAHRCKQLERLIRYTARGAVSLERLEEDESGDLVYTFTRPWSDGTTGINRGSAPMVTGAPGTRRRLSRLTP